MFGCERKINMNNHLFLFSHIASAKREGLVRKIKDLGGTYIESTNFDKRISHLICGSLKKTEKFFGACIMGKWILSPQFIEDSHQIGMWLEEENYLFRVENKDPLKDQLAKTARRWRINVDHYKMKPFLDWQVSVLMAAEKASLNKRLLRYGGANVLSLKVPFSKCSNIRDVTYVFVDSYHAAYVPELQEFGLLCLQEKFLEDSILQDPPPDHCDYIISDSTLMETSLDDTSCSQHRKIDAKDNQKESRPAASQLQTNVSSNTLHSTSTLLSSTHSIQRSVDLGHQSSGQSSSLSPLVEIEKQRAGQTGTVNPPASSSSGQKERSVDSCHTSSSFPTTPSTKTLMVDEYENVQKRNKRIRNNDIHENDGIDTNPSSSKKSKKALEYLDPNLPSHHSIPDKIDQSKIFRNQKDEGFMRISNQKERTAPKKSVSKVMENKTIEDHSILYKQDIKRNKGTNHSLPASIYLSSQKDSGANGKRNHFKKDSGAKAEKTLLTNGFLHESDLSKIDNNRLNVIRLRHEYMENRASDTENGVNAVIDNSVTSETSATGNILFSPKVKLRDVLQSTAYLKNDSKKDVNEETSEENVAKHEQDKKGNERSKHSLSASIYLSPQKDSCANGKREHSLPVDICLDIMQMDASSKKDSGAKAEKTSVSNGFLHDSDLSENDNELSNDRRLRFEFMENHASENVEIAIIDTGSSSVTSETTSATGNVKLPDMSTANFEIPAQSRENDSKNDSKKDVNGETSRENIIKHEQDKKGNERAKHSLSASLYLSPQKDSCASSTISAQSKETDLIKDANTKTSRKKRSINDINQNNERSVEKRKTPSQKKSASSLKGLPSSHKSKDKGKVFQSSLFKFGFGSTTKSKNKYTALNSPATTNLLKPKLEPGSPYNKLVAAIKKKWPPNDMLLALKDEIIYISSTDDEDDEKDCKKTTTTTTTTSVRKNLFLSEEIGLCDEEAIVLEVEENTKSTVSNESVSISSKEFPVVPLQHTSQRDSDRTVSNESVSISSKESPIVPLQHTSQRDSDCTVSNEIVSISSKESPVVPLQHTSQRDSDRTVSYESVSISSKESPIVPLQHTSQRDSDRTVSNESVSISSKESPVVPLQHTSQRDSDCTVSSESVSISSKESPVVPLQHTSQRDSVRPATSQGGNAIRKSSYCEKDDKLKVSSVRLDRLGEANLKDDNIDSSYAKDCVTRDSLPHVVWPLSFSFNWDLSNTSEPPFLPSIISQCMESSRENGFYSTALDHGRPTLARKPTAELLGQFVQMLMSVDTTVMNEAFSDLMSWAENHPPLAPSMVKVYSDLFEITTGQEFLSSLLQKLTEISVCDGTDLLLEFTVAVLEMNFSSCLRLQDKKMVKDCLLIKWLWTHSRAIHHNSKTKELLRVFESILARPESSSSVRHSISTLISLVAECLRLVSVQWSTQNRNYQSDSVTSFALDTAKVIREVCPKEEPFLMVSYLLSFKPAWFRTLITASLLSFSNDYLLQQSVEVHDISLRAIVSQYFFLLPPLSNQSDSTHRSSKISTSQSNNTELSTISENEMLHLKDLSAAKVNKRNGKGESAVHTAAIKGDVVTLKKLLNVPCVDVNLKDNNGWTPLHEACNHGRYDCVEALLKYVPPKTVEYFFQKKDSASSKVDINAAGDLEITPLHDAVLNDRVEICRLLLRYGGKRLLETKTVKGYTAFDLAGTEEMINILNSVWYTGSCNNSLDLSQDTQSEDSLSLSQSELIKSTTYIPSQSRYSEVLQQGTDLRTASYLNCSLFLSLISLLLTSYLESNAVHETINLNLMSKDDKSILCRMKAYLKMLRKHLRKITAKDTFESLQSELLILAVAVSAN